jgi:hypothetical protein
MEKIVTEEIQKNEILVKESKELAAEAVKGVKRRADRDLDSEFQGQLLAEALANKFVNYCSKVTGDYGKVGLGQRMLTDVEKQRQARFEVCYGK